MTFVDWLMIFGYFGVLAMVVVATRRRQETPGGCCLTAPP